jgi:uncharacterized protein YidB (DUF937 family)
MLDQLTKLVEQHAGKAIVQNDAVPNQNNNAAIQEVANQIFNGLKTQVAQGNVQQVVSMFKGQNAQNVSSNPLVSNLINQVSSSLAQKFGMSPQAAQNIAQSLLPTVMNSFVQKTNDPNNNEFDLQNMMQGFTGNSKFDVSSVVNQIGGKAGGITGALGKLFGK